MKEHYQYCRVTTPRADDLIFVDACRLDVTAAFFVVDNTQPSANLLAFLVMSHALSFDDFIPFVLRFFQTDITKGKLFPVGTFQIVTE